LVFACLLTCEAAAQEFISEFERVNTLLKWKYYDDAITQLDNILDTGKEPYASRAKFLKGICYLKKKQASDAISIFQGLIDSKYLLTDYTLYFLGNYYMGEKEYDAAKDYFRILTSKFPKSALSRISRLNEADCLYELKNYGAACKIYEEFTDSYPADDNVDKAIFNLARCREKTGKLSEAFHAYSRIQLYHPLSRHLKESNQRIAYLSRKYGFELQADTDKTLFNKAMIFYNKQDFRSASYFLKQIVKSYKRSDIFDEALFTLAFCDYRQRRFGSAATRFRICINRGGEFADDSQFYLAFCYGRRGYFYEALEALKNVINNYPNSSYTDDAVYYLAYYYDQNNFRSAATTCYEQLIRDYPDSSYLDDALWRAGYNYYFEGNYERAFNSFDRAAMAHSKSNMSAECAYWKALTLEKMGRNIESATAYRYVIENFDHTYYSHRAMDKLSALGINISELDNNDIKIADIEFGKEFFESQPYGSDLSGEAEPYPLEESFEVNQKQTKTAEIPGPVKIDLGLHFKKYAELISAGLYNEAEIEAKWLIAGSTGDKRQSARLALSAALLGGGKYRDAIIIAEGICNNGMLNMDWRGIPKITWHLAYPKGYNEHVQKYSEIYGLDPLLVFSVIREESRFNPKTLSWARAHGLMQIIPRTGYDVASLLRIKPYYSKRLYDPEINIKMGCYYLSILMKKFDGNKMLALAAYNGGPNNVKRWLNAWRSRHGDNLDVDEFVENIPLSETKRYVQKVMKSYSEYKRTYKERAATLTDLIYYHE